MYNPFSLENKTILVTGASSGIGKSIAVECSKLGATVIITARNKQRLQDTYDMLDVSFNQKHQLLCADLEKEEQVIDLVNNVSLLNGVVCCAGINDPTLFKFETKEKIKKIMDSNFLSTVMLMNTLMIRKKMEKSSSIIFISSIVGNKITFLAQSIYAASKAALAGFSKGLALELAPRNIRVNTIMPGMVRTNILEKGTITEEQLLEDEKKYPLKRYGNPEDIAYSAIYLLSDASCWVTGSDLVIDGGFTLQ